MSGRKERGWDVGRGEEMEETGSAGVRKKNKKERVTIFFHELYESYQCLYICISFTTKG